MYDNRLRKVPNEESRIEVKVPNEGSPIEEIGLLLRTQILRMGEAFAEVKASLKGQSLEPGMLRKISSLAAAVEKGTASAPPTAVVDKPPVVDSSQLFRDFPNFVPGPVVDQQSIAEVVSHYRTLGLSAVGCKDSSICQIYYDPDQNEAEFSFQL